MYRAAYEEIHSNFTVEISSLIYLAVEATGVLCTCHLQKYMQLLSFLLFNASSFDQL